MARAVGIRVGLQSYDFVVLDGGSKKVKVVAAVSGEVPPDAEDPFETISEELKKLAKKYKASPDNVCLTVDAGFAAFRSVALPFADKAKIEEVLKFEVESQLPQWDIDSVVVDFHTISSSAVESHLLVTAVPKEILAERIRVCTRGGVEPIKVELDSVSLVNAATYAGVLEAEGAQILVHVGESSTSIVVVEAGHLVSMRAIRRGGIFHGAIPAVGEEGEAVDESAPVAAAPIASIGSPEHARRQAETAARIRREIVRTITGSRSELPFQAIYLSGFELPGLSDEAILDVPVHSLDLLGAPAGEPEGEAEPPVPVAAFGAAYRMLGGGILRSELRREELRYAGKLERLELPLAILALLGLTVFAVHWIVIEQQIKRQEFNMRIWLENSNYCLLGDLARGQSGYLKRPPKRVTDYVSRLKQGAVAEETQYEQLQYIKAMLDTEVREMGKEIGEDTEGIKQPQSALEGLTLVLNVLDSMGEERVGRFRVRGATADYRIGMRGEKDTVEVRLDMSFFGSTVEAQSHFTNYFNELRSQPWADEVPEVATNALESGSGILVDNLRVIVDLAGIEWNYDAGTTL